MVKSVIKFIISPALFCFFFFFLIEEILSETLYSPGFTDFSLGPLPSCRAGASFASILGIFFPSLLHFLFPGSSYLVYFLIAQRCVCVGRWGGADIYSNNVLQKGEQEIFCFWNSVSLTISLFYPYMWLMIWMQNSKWEMLLLFSLWTSPLAVERNSNALMPDLWVWVIFSRIFPLFWFSEISQ